MNEDQFQRHVDFILAQQAKSEQNLARHGELFAKLAGLISGLANYNEDQDERIAAHDRQIEANDRQIAALIEAGKETDKRFRETDERFRETDERFRETDERINILIKVVERYYDGNGK